jgi:hypothetical protein
MTASHEPSMLKAVEAIFFILGFGYPGPGSQLGGAIPVRRGSGPWKGQWVLPGFVPSSVNAGSSRRGLCRVQDANRCGGRAQDVQPARVG